MWQVRAVRLGRQRGWPAAYVVTCCLAPGLDPSVTPAGKSFENWYNMPCPALEPALRAQHVILYMAVPFAFHFSHACADRMYISVGGKAPSVRYLHGLFPVFYMGTPGCSVCVVVRCSCSRPLASRLGSVRGVPGSLSSVPCRASQLRWCVRQCLRAVAGGQGGLAWWHAGLLLTSSSSCMINGVRCILRRCVGCTVFVGAISGSWRSRIIPPPLRCVGA